MNQNEIDDEFLQYILSLIIVSIIVIPFWFLSAQCTDALMIVLSIWLFGVTLSTFIYRKSIMHKLSNIKLPKPKLFNKHHTTYRLKKNIKITSLDNIGKLHETIKGLERLKEVYEYAKKYDGVKLQFFKHTECEDRGDVYTQVCIQSYVIDGDAKDAIADGLESYIEELEIALSKYVDM